MIKTEGETASVKLYMQYNTYHLKHKKVKEKKKGLLLKILAFDTSKKTQTPSSDSNFF